MSVRANDRGVTIPMHCCVLEFLSTVIPGIMYFVELNNRAAAFILRSITVLKLK